MKKQNYAIDFEESININGSMQNIRVRAAQTNLPVVLFLHGGPGVCDRHNVLEKQSRLSSVCTIVCWDQRGAGKSFDKAEFKKPFTLNMMLDDAKAVTDYLRKKFGVAKIYVVGHSWGTVLGVMLADRCPDAIAAYLGMGQFVHGIKNEELSYDFCLNEAIRTKDNKAVAALTRIGRPINGNYANQKDMLVQRDYLTKYGGETYKQRNKSMVKALMIPLLKSPEYNLKEIINYAKGGFACADKLMKEIIELDFFTAVKKLDMPVYITQGRHDYNTPSALAKEWFDKLDAPKKQWVWFEDSAHSPILEESKLWGQTVANLFFGKQLLEK